MPKNVHHSRPKTLHQLARLAAAIGALSLLGPASSFAQFGPGVAMVVPNDSVVAREALVRARELAQGGTEPEAVRVLQNLLDQEGDKVLEVAEGSPLSIPVRRHVHQLLQGMPELLERYRLAQAARAQELLDQGELVRVEQTMLLTRAGLTAAARLAQREVEAAQFDSALVRLRQLEDHPDRQKNPAAALEGARAAVLVASYLPRADAKDLASRWSQHARSLGAVPPAETAYARPPELDRPISPQTPGLALDVTSIPRDPLQSLDLAAGRAELGDAWANDPTREDAAPLALCFPLAAGNLVLVNDGATIRALDRETISPLWSVEPPRAVARPDDSTPRRLFGRFPEDTMSVTLAGTPRGGVALATTGLAIGGGRVGDARVHAVDVATGALLWSVDPAYLSPAFAGASVRGPIVVDGDVAILAARKSGSVRVGELRLAGLDLYTGKLRWERVIASTGQLPWGNGQRRCDAMTLEQGIVFRADEMGVAAAVEASSGRPVWVRRLRPARTFDGRFTRGGEGIPPHAQHAPVAHQDSVFIIEPSESDDQAALLRLDRATGELLGLRPLKDLGSPWYALIVGEDLALVARDRVSFVAADAFEAAPVRATPLLVDAPPGSGKQIPGRVQVVGRQLLVPSDQGPLLIDPAAPDQSVRLDSHARGNLVSAGTQLLAADRQALASYVRWETARASILARQEREPANTALMLTFVELCHRAGQLDEAPAMAERALAALDASLSPGTPQPDRRRLFRLAGDIVRAGADAGIADRLLRAMERSADGPTERTEYLLELADQRLQRAQFARAVEPYQEILTDPALARAAPPTDGPAIFAADLATQRLLEVVRREGPGVYAPFDEEAARRAQDLPPAPDPEALEALAAQYPASRAAVDLWSRAADRHHSRGHLVPAAQAQARALRAAQAALVEQPADPVRVSAQRLISLLVDAGRPSQAARVHARLLHEQPALSLDPPTAPAPADALPRVGPALRVDAAHPLQTFPSREIVEPIVSAAPASDAVLLHDPSAKAVEYHAITPHDQRLARAWSRSYERHAPSLLWHDASTTYLYWPSLLGGRVEAVANASGATRWKSDEFATFFQGADASRLASTDRFSTPLMGEVRAGDLIVAMEPDCLVLVERAGRAARLDLATGATRWAARLPLQRAYDAALVGDKLVVVGAGDAQGADETAPRIALVSREDAAPAGLLGVDPEQARELGSHLRWIRAVSPTLAAVGLADSVAFIDTPEARILWTAGAPIRDSGLGVPAGEQLLVVDAEARLWSLPLDRAAAPTRVETQGKMEYPIRVHGSERAGLVRSQRGLLVVGPGAKVLGIDALPVETRLTPAAVARDVCVAMDITVAPQSDSFFADSPSRRQVPVYFFDNTSARLVGRDTLLLRDEPETVLLLDSKLLITAGGVTFAFDAPEPTP